MKDTFYPSYSTGVLDPQARNFLTAIAAANMPPLSELTPELARERNIVKAFSLKPPRVASADDHTIAGPFGDIPVRLYLPDGEGPFSAMVYLHGGGWVVGTLDDFDAVCRTLCHGAGIAVVSVDYRLSPEFPFPVALEEGYTVLEWLSVHGTSWQIDPARLMVGGDSAGGNMATVLTLMARDRKGPMPVFQLLICPATDLAGLDTLSYRQFGYGLWVPVDLMKWYIRQYLPSPADAVNPYVSPLLASGLSDLPPACILTAEFDVVRDEGEAYAARLASSGVPVTVKQYAGQIHDFVIFGRVMNRAAEALEDCCTEIRKISFG